MSGSFYSIRIRAADFKDDDKFHRDYDSNYSPREEEFQPAIIHCDWSLSRDKPTLNVMFCQLPSNHSHVKYKPNERVKADVAGILYTRDFTQENKHPAEFDAVFGSDYHGGHVYLIHKHTLGYSDAHKLIQITDTGSLCPTCHSKRS
eukprot:2827062-Rhodomonas_salina.1